jgi:hypothetical protein
MMINLYCPKFNYKQAEIVGELYDPVDNKQVVLSVALRPDSESCMACSNGALRAHSLNTPPSVGLLWTSDQTDAESYDNNKKSQET